MINNIARSPKKVAIVQSNYIPWKGYFDLINMVDEFIFYDDMQYTRRDWRNRNIIKTPQGTRWLSIPVDVKGKYHQTVRETKISDPQWHIKHWSKIKNCYSRALYFQDYKDLFESLYLAQAKSETYLSLINYRFITAINELLGIDTKLSWSSDFQLIDGRTERLVKICKDAGAMTYISGPAAKDYFDMSVFNREGIKVEWMDYSGYPEYRQIHGAFEHSVTIVDLIFNEGPNALQFMNSWQTK
jgi:hypothetical protein